MQRRLLTSMLGVAVAAVLVFGAGLAVTALAHGPARPGCWHTARRPGDRGGQHRGWQQGDGRVVGAYDDYGERCAEPAAGVTGRGRPARGARAAGRRRARGAQARRLARPVRDLARAADRIGSGDARPVGRRYGIAELDRVAEGLDNSAKRVSDLISAEQDFAVDASHQLRTPLTALSMRLEEMVAAADDPEVVREEGSGRAGADRPARAGGRPAARPGAPVIVGRADPVQHRRHHRPAGGGVGAGVPRGEQEA